MLTAAFVSLAVLAMAAVLVGRGPVRGGGEAVPRPRSGPEWPEYGREATHREDGEDGEGGEGGEGGEEAGPGAVEQ